MLSNEVRASLEDHLDDVFGDEQAEDTSTEVEASEEEQVASAADAENEVVDEEAPQASHEDSVPYERFKQVLEENRSLSDRMKSIEDRFAPQKEEVHSDEPDYDSDPFEVLEGRISRMEQHRAEQMLVAELDVVKSAHPVFKSSDAEDVLLDLIAANPRTPVADLANRIAPLFKSAGEPEVVQEKAPPPETPPRPSSSGVSSAAARNTDAKSPKTIAEASALLRKRLSGALTLR